MADSDIIITEIMYDPDNSVNDNNYEWVEVFNSGSGSVSLNGWTLDDSNTNNNPVGAIPNITLAAGDVAIFYNGNISEADFIAEFNPASNAVLIPVSPWQALNNSNGDSVNLFNASNDTIASVNYADDANPGQSLGYSTTGAYEGAGSPTPGVVCFTAGTKISTNIGDKAVETLSKGDLVLTKDHGFKPIFWIGRRVVSSEELHRNSAFRPVTIKKSAISHDIPNRDTRVSQQHRLFIGNWRAHLLFGQSNMLCAAVNLVDGQNISVDQGFSEVEYIHILFDQHEIIYGDKMPSESFHPVECGISSLAEAAQLELFSLFPELETGTTFSACYPEINRAEAELLPT